jgi:soluble lytic murein transglycosylase-like protein
VKIDIPRTEHLSLKIKNFGGRTAAPGKKLEQAARDFEALFLQQLLKFATPEQDGMEMENYREHYWQLLSRELSRREPLGIAAQIRKELAASVGPLRGESRKTTAEVALPLDRLVKQSARKYGLDPRLLEAVMQVESAGNPRAVSRKGALGLMQLMPATARELGVGNPLDPRENLEGGARYLSRLLARYQGDLEMALGAYNAGPGTVDRYGGVPPWPETRAYIEKIKERLRGIKEL